MSRLVRIAGCAVLAACAAGVTLAFCWSEPTDSLHRTPDECAESAQWIRESLTRYGECEAKLVDVASQAFIEPEVAAVVQRVAVEDLVPDAEWLAYPRSTFSFPERVRQPKGLQASELFRHVDLNRKDEVLSHAARDELDTLVSQRVETLGDLRAYIHTQSADELALLARSGRARHVNYRDFVAGLTSAQQEEIERAKRGVERRFLERGFSEAKARHAADHGRYVAGSNLFPFEAFAIRNDGDDFFAASLDELPLTRDAVEAYRAAVVDFSARVLEVFVREECLYSLQRERLLDRITAEL